MQFFNLLNFSSINFMKKNNFSIILMNGFGNARTIQSQTLNFKKINKPFVGENDMLNGQIIIRAINFSDIHKS